MKQSYKYLGLASSIGWLRIKKGCGHFRKLGNIKPEGLSPTSLGSGVPNVGISAQVSYMLNKRNEMPGL